MEKFQISKTKREKARRILNKVRSQETSHEPQVTFDNNLTGESDLTAGTLRKSTNCDTSSENESTSTYQDKSLSDVECLDNFEPDDDSYESEVSDNDNEESIDEYQSTDKNSSYWEYVFSLDLREFLIFWILTFGISRKAADVLLKYIKYREEKNIEKSNLPNNIKTLLKTPRNSNAIQEVFPGSYVHFGLIKGLVMKDKEINYSDLHKKTKGEIILDLNWDGGEAVKSRKSTIWPVQAKIANLSMVPILVGLYHGPAKPENFDEFLKPLVDELKPFINDNKKVEINDLKFSLKIQRIILDNPAKCATFKLWAANSKNGCARCYVIGRHDKESKTQLFDVINEYQKVSDTDFETPFSSSNTMDKRKEPTNILQKELGVKLVSQVPMDPMHDFDLGVVKRFVDIFARKTNIRQKIDEKQLMIRNVFQPSEFQRRARGISDCKYWKASEHKNFVQYYGLFSLKNVISDEQYDHFLLLSLSARILSRDEFKNKWTALVNPMLKKFLENVENLYGKSNLVCCVHKLSHLADECVIQDSPLYSFSAYPFESFMGSIMKLSMYSHKNILSQIYHRVNEIQNGQQILQSSKQFEEFKIFQEKSSAKIYKVHYQGMIIRDNFNDANFLDTEGRHIVVLKITKTEQEKVILKCREMKNLKNAFEIPFKSKFVGIFIWANGNYGCEELSIEVENLARKLFVLPFTEDQKQMLILPMSKQM